MNTQAINATGATPTLARFTIDRAPLLAALALQVRVIERRNTIPILSNVLVCAQPDGTVTLTGTDLDVTATHTLQADDLASAGRFTVAAATLHDLVRSAPDKSRITFTQDGDRCYVESGRGRVALPTLPAADFPIHRPLVAAVAFELPAVQLAADLGATSVAQSTEPTRYYLNGTFMHVRRGTDGPDGMAFVATDGHRAVVIDRPLPEGAAELGDSIIPSKAVDIVLRAIDKAKAGTVAIERGAKEAIAFAFGNVLINSKLIDGTFPDYTRVIPPEAAAVHVVHISPSMLADAVKRVATVSSEKTRIVRLDMDRDRATLSCTSAENGTASEELPCDYVADASFVGFNHRYLSQCLGLVKRAEMARLAYHDSTSPTLITFPCSPHMRIVLMPTRVCEAPVTKPSAVPQPRHQDAFCAAFETAWAARDKAGMDAACAAYRAARLGADASPAERRAVTSYLCRETQEIKCVGTVRRHLVTDQPRQYNDPDRPLAQLAMVERTLAAYMGWLATLPGYHAADPRDVLPVEVPGRRGRCWVRKADLETPQASFRPVDQAGDAIIYDHLASRRTRVSRQAAAYVSFRAIAAVKPGRNEAERKLIRDAIFRYETDAIIETIRATADIEPCGADQPSDEPVMDVRPVETSTPVAEVTTTPDSFDNQLAAIMARVDGVALALAELSRPEPVQRAAKPRDGVRLLIVRRYLAMRRARAIAAKRLSVQIDVANAHIARADAAEAERETLRGHAWGYRQRLTRMALSLRARLRDTRRDLAGAQAESRAARDGLAAVTARVDALSQLVQPAAQALPRSLQPVA